MTKVTKRSDPAVTTTVRGRHIRRKLRPDYYAPVAHLPIRVLDHLGLKPPQSGERYKIHLEYGFQSKMDENTNQVVQVPVVVLTAMAPNPKDKYNGKL